MTALLGEAAFFIPGYECNAPVAPSDFDRLISGYRLTSPYSDRLIDGPPLLHSKPREAPKWRLWGEHMV